MYSLLQYKPYLDYSTNYPVVGGDEECDTVDVSLEKLEAEAKEVQEGKNPQKRGDPPRNNSQRANTVNNHSNNPSNTGQNSHRPPTHTSNHSSKSANKPAVPARPDPSKLSKLKK